LLQTRNKIGAGELFFNQDLKKLECFINYNQYQKAIKQVANTKGNPAKKKTLDPGNPGKNAQAIVSFYPIRIPGYPFDKDRANNKQNPAPAFHHTGKKTGNKFLQVINC